MTVKWKWFAFFCAIALLFFYFYWKQETYRPEVEVAEVRLADIPITFSADGIVKGKEIQVSAKNAGYLQSIAVKEGVSVNQGELLFRLDDSEVLASLREAEANVRSAEIAISQAKENYFLSQENYRTRLERSKALLRAGEARLEQLLSGARQQEIARTEEALNVARVNMEEAGKHYERMKQPYENDAISKSELDVWESKYKAAQAEYESARHNLELIKSGAREEEIKEARAMVEAARADVRSAENLKKEIDIRRDDVRLAESRKLQAEAVASRIRAHLKDYTVYSPVGGRVLRLHFEGGEMITPGVLLKVNFTVWRQRGGSL